MATYVIGDIQGCFDTFQSLLLRIKFQPNQDKLILLGDVINRGPKSLEVLRFIIQHENIISMVLGNHEIFALALMLGAIEPKSPPTHTLEALFLASDRSDLINWLRSRPIIIKDKNNIFVHAGILPSWTVDQALDLATQVHEKLVGLDPANFLKEYFENINNNTNNPDISLALASFTLMRLVSSKSEINLNYSGTLQNIPDNLEPWFKLRDDKATDIFFGHWAALGVYNYKNYHCLDSGCGWGRCLSALRLEDRMLFQVDNCDLKYIES